MADNSAAAAPLMPAAAPTAAEGAAGAATAPAAGAADAAAAGADSGGGGAAKEKTSKKDKKEKKKDKKEKKKEKKEKKEKKDKGGGDGGGDDGDGKPAGPRFVVKKWNACAMWSWDICTDTCAICRNKLTEPSIEYQANPQAESSGLHIAWGECGHVFHHDCIQRWCKTRHTCPLCNTDWKLAKVESMDNTVEDTTSGSGGGAAASTSSSSSSAQ